MKKNLMSFLGLLLVITIMGCGGNPNKKETYKSLKLETYNDTLNWVYGYLIAQNVFGPMKEVAEEDFQPGHMMKGAFDKIEKNELLDQKALQAFLQEHSKKVRERIKKEQEKESEANIKKGGVFLDENAKKEGVVTTETGLQYEVLKNASGKKPVDGDKVSVHYHGTLVDGTVFDSSVDRGQPANFGLNQVIKGWQEGLKLMTVGSKYKFYVPSELGYGNTRVGNIPASSVLVFEVELLEILDN